MARVRVFYGHQGVLRRPTGLVPRTAEAPEKVADDQAQDAPATDDAPSDEAAGDDAGDEPATDLPNESWSIAQINEWAEANEVEAYPKSGTKADKLAAVEAHLFIVEATVLQGGGGFEEPTLEEAVGD